MKRLNSHGTNAGTTDGAVSMPRYRLIVLAAAAFVISAGSAAEAGDGFLDRLFGGTQGAAPANPFASNYPSAPPTPADVRAARDARAVRRARGGDSGPVPPGRIPEE